MSGAGPGTAAVLRTTALLAAVAGTVAAGTVLAPVPDAATSPAGGSGAREVRVPDGDAVLACAGAPESPTEALGDEAVRTDESLSGRSRQSGALRALALSPPGEGGSAAGSTDAGSTDAGSTDADSTDAAGDGGSGGDAPAGGGAASSAVPPVGEAPPLTVAPLPAPGAEPGLGDAHPGTSGEGLSAARTDGAAAVLRAAGSGGARPALAALRTVQAAAGDLAGLSASTCAQPAEQSWLLGGGAAVGRSAQLVLANPGPTAAAVDLSVLTPAGPVESRAGTGLALEPGEQRRVFVEGLAPGAEALAVGVTASAGRVAATLQDTLLSGIVPGGTADVAPSAPARRLVLPGVSASDGAPDPVLRLAAPGDTAAVVSWRAVGRSGPVGLDGEAAATVEAGTVVEVPLRGLGAAETALLVESDAPVLAGVQVRTGRQGGPRGLAWVQPALPLAGPVAVPLPADDEIGWRLGVTGDGERAEHLLVLPLAADGTRGRAVPVRVAPGRVATLSDAQLDARDAAGLLLVPAGGGGQARAALRLSALADGDRRVTAVVAVPPAPEPAATLTAGQAPAGRWS